LHIYIYIYIYIYNSTSEKQNLVSTDAAKMNVNHIFWQNHASTSFCYIMQSDPKVMFYSIWLSKQNESTGLIVWLILATTKKWHHLDHWKLIKFIDRSTRGVMQWKRYGWSSSSIAQTIEQFYANWYNEKKNCLNKFSCRAPVYSFINLYHGLKFMAELLGI